MSKQEYSTHELTFDMPPHLEIGTFKIARIVAIISLLYSPCLSGDSLVFSNASIESNFNEPSSSCTEMLNSFAFHSSNFTYCVIQHSRPITLCRDCITSYLNLKEVYKNILHLEDSGGVNCKDQLINLDRLQVVDSNFKYVDQLWQRASCISCFLKRDSSALSEKVVEILTASSEYDKCVDDNRNSSVKTQTEICINCVDNYTHLNNLYNNMRADSGDINFCMDIIDMMNTTRYNWSNNLKCCNDRKKPEKAVFLIMGGIVFSTILFYVMVYAFTRKAELPLMPQNRWKEKYSKRQSITSAISS